ncbi:MAG: 4'-phosphopantetheinyl transferase superfamily protein [Chloroflexi bacterium]|nr:4'-phosphopantetheinyl transferase superfamily protein [Chloroflexota bacterium]
MEWTAVAQPIAPLVQSEIHLYSAVLDIHHSGTLTHLLSADEQERAQRLRFEQDRRRFIVRRGLLRQLLGVYLSQEAQTLKFAYTLHRKPYLPGYPLHFNVADAEDRALFAFARYQALGVDLEHMHPMPDMEDVVSSMFSATEQRMYRALPAAQKSAGFFNCWTRKEAFIKAMGEGLSYPLADFDVSLKPGAAARVLAVRGDAQSAAAWTLLDLRPAKDFVGALAVVGHDWLVRSYALLAG